MPDRPPEHKPKPKSEPRPKPEQTADKALGHRITLGGETLQLLPDKAVWWAREKILFVADTHFGKGGVFRAAGVAIPTGTTDADLQRLSQLIAAHQPQRLIVLGDFLHGKPSEQVIQQVADWLATINAAITVVRGNHDRHMQTVPTSWSSIEFIASLTIGSLTLQHEPLELAEAIRGTVLAGHTHPVTRLKGPGRDSLRLPVFWQQTTAQGEQLVLPSFGQFTGGYVVDSFAAGCKTRLYAAGDTEVIPLF